MLTLDFILNNLHFGKTATFGGPLSGCAGLLHGKGSDITPKPAELVNLRNYWHSSQTSLTHYPNTPSMISFSFPAAFSGSLLAIMADTTANPESP